MYRKCIQWSLTHSHVTWVRNRIKYILSSLNTFFPFSHTREFHYQWFRRCKEGTCCSFFCNFATRVRMDSEALFVIVRLSALLPVWRSTSFFFCFHLSFSPFLPLSSYFVTSFFLLSLSQTLPTFFYFVYVQCMPLLDCFHSRPLYDGTHY